MAVLTVVTGLPGHGKTINTIKEVEEQHADRPVYYAHIDKLTIQRWHKIDDVEKWYEIEPGAVIVIDEAHHYFPRRGNAKGLEPRHVAEMTEHRHNGHDVYLITQDAKNIDHFIRRLAGRHVHYWRPFGASRVTRWEWPKVVNPDDFDAKRNATSKRMVKLDKSYFGLYHSAEVHTVKRKIPLKMLLLPAASLFVAAAAYAGYSSLHDIAAPVAPVAPVVSVAPVAPSPGGFVAVAASPAVRVDARISGIVQFDDRGIVLIEVDGDTLRFSLAELNCVLLYRWTCIYNGSQLRF